MNQRMLPKMLIVVPSVIYCPASYAIFGDFVLLLMIFRLHIARHFIDDVPVCEDIVSDVFATLWDRATSLHLMIDCDPAYIKMCIRNACPRSRSGVRILCPAIITSQ